MPKQNVKAARSQHAFKGNGATPSDSKPTLSPPSRDMAKRILTEVGWQERLEGYRTVPMAGNLREFIFKFKDATNLLHANVGDPWSTRSGYFGYFDFDELIAWIRDVFGDTELASAISERITSDSSLKDKIEAAKPLMEQRLRQCEDILGEEA